MSSIPLARVAAADPGNAAISPADRYSRQILFPGIGQHGQERLSSARVGIVGVGATGAATSSLLARAGVGHLTLIDRDFVEPSNLQRQALFDEADARDCLPKAEAARRRLLTFNSDVQIHPHIADLTPSNISSLLGSCDLLLDATDNFETRYLLNDFAVSTGKPWVYAAAVAAYAASMTVLPRTPPEAPTPSWQPTACLACIFPKPPSGAVETCDTAGILATAVNLAASLQATEALKILTGQWSAVRRSLFSVDLWTPRSGSLDTAEIRTGSPREDCEVCAARHFVHLAGTQRPQITLCGRNSVQIHERHRPLDLRSLEQSLRSHPELTSVRANDLLLRFQRGELTASVFPDGRAVITGTTDPTVARSFYARFIGS